MAQRFYTIDLQDTSFPMLSTQQARTTIVPADGESNANNRPGIAYCHNVMPTQYGIQSIGYSKVIAETTGDPLVNSMVFVMYGNFRTKYYVMWSMRNPIATRVKFITAIAYATPTFWRTFTALPGFVLSSLTVATVNGISYICSGNAGVATIDESTDSLNAVSLSGISISDVKGIIASSGYLIAYTESAVAWSSTIDPTDFVPSQITGAGGGNIAGLAGDILFAVATAQGFILYTEDNAVAATYTGNVSYPFRFNEVAESRGGVSLDQTSFAANSNTQYAYTKAGLQSVTPQGATEILPEVTSFLEGRLFEDYNEITKEYELSELPDYTGGSFPFYHPTMYKRVRFIASRYLVVSYGPYEVTAEGDRLPTFTHALVLDTALNKVGKLRIDHTDVFNFTFAKSDTLVTLRDEWRTDNITFLKRDGSCYNVNFYKTAESKGVIVLGKLQYSRTRVLQLLGVSVENVPEGADLSVSTQASLDGKNFTVVEGTQAVDDDNVREYAFRSVAKNHSLTLVGQFDLVTLIARYTTQGRR